MFRSRFTMGTIAGLVLAFNCWAVIGFADGDNDDSLEKRVAQLEKELKIAKEDSTAYSKFVQTLFGGPVHFGAFVDAYYAYDFKEPPSGVRKYTTQPLLHNNFSVNLAYVEAKVAEEKYRGRVAFQIGTSVDANYAAEPNTFTKFIQEAYAGYSPINNLWIDAGIFFSHIGNESFISRDNWNYSRSLSADYSPYYQTGIRLTYQWCKELSTQVQVLNGWQNITDNNAAKAVGMQVAFQPNEHFTLTYNNFIGKEVRDDMRYFNEFIAKVEYQPVGIAFTYDLGAQQFDFHPAGLALWHVFTLVAHYQVTQMISLGARGERFIDKDQIVVTTNSPHGFQTWGASGNIDIQLLKNLVWRNEYRNYWSVDNIYPNKSNGSSQDQFAVTSLALSF